jgi:hypothetical protein
MANIGTDALLHQIIDHYLKSRDFNGFYLAPNEDDQTIAKAVDLVRNGMVQVVGEVDYPNPYIRPWPSRRTKESQVESLARLRSSAYGICLYPTPTALNSIHVPAGLDGHPFATQMARGRGTLELAYFSVDVLEQYRNDPRYHFQYSDFGVNMGIGDEAYLDETELARDKTSLGHIGFAYDLRNYDSSDVNTPLVRRVAAFFGDLAKLTPEHQQRWNSYQVTDDDLRPHPAWWMTQMGNWADGIGPFEHLFLELSNLNQLWDSAFGSELFARTQRPRDFGWMLRSSQKEWDEFVVQLDKVLSENIQHKALTAAGVSAKNDQQQNLGSLGRLTIFLEKNGITQSVAKDLMRPFHEVRQARQKPAHSLRANITDKTFVHRQVALLEDVNGSLQELTRWLSTHPKNRGWKPRFEVDTYYRF